MILHSDIPDSEVRKQIRDRLILFGGNKRLKIYGTLYCRSGKRMKRNNRVFFNSEQEALQHKFRPCGHCMVNAYKKWRADAELFK
jgi:methylphosphotriester-DNA--protein-cysteine methyltransferase